MAKKNASPKRTKTKAKVTAKKTASATKTASTKASVTKAPATKKAASGKKTASKKTSATKAPAKKTASTKAPAAKTTPKQAPAKKTAATKAPAATPPSSGFAGFPRDLFQFLAELGLNNEREWFEPRKARYESSVREPALAFIRAMVSRLPEVSPHFVAVDKKVGGSRMRLHRDVRFSKDKSPYKTNVGIQFRHSTGKDVHAPGLYLHLEPGECFVGVGLWHPEPEALQAIRHRIREEPESWTRVRHEPAFTAAFELHGESLQRPPRGVDPEHPHVEDLKRKDHIAVASLSIDTITSPAAVDEISGLFTTARSYLRFLCEAVGVAF